MRVIVSGPLLRAIAALCLLSVSLVALADDCPSPAKLPAVCMAISNAQKDTSGKYTFHYEKLICDAACVASSDTDEVRGDKIRRMWKANEDKLVCNSPRFDVQQGNVLKYAASVRFEDFLFDAAMVWKVDLNRVDPSDGRTVLDYVQEELERNKGTSVESKLRSYYDMLRSSGAKHRREL